MMQRIRPFEWLRCIKDKAAEVYDQLMDEPRYDADKFEELLVYIVSRTEDETTSGDTKLNKLLYFADVTAYRRLGKPISGASYKHQERGPIATPLVPVRNNVEGTRLEVEEQAMPSGGVWRKTRALDEARLDAFNQEELEIIDEVISHFSGWGAKAMEDAAHNEPAWRVTKEGEKMKYRSSLLVRKASPAAIDYGEKLAERLGR